jgi:hypothetical protein
MSRGAKTGLALVIVALLIGLVGWLQSCDLSDADQVRLTIYQVAEGAEEADLGKSLEPFSEHYSDPEGVDKKGIQAILWMQYNKRGPISVWLSPIEVVVDGESAHAAFEVGLVEGAQGMLSWPVGVATLHFEVDLQREDGDWQILSHTREAALGMPDTG